MIGVIHQLTDSFQNAVISLILNQQRMSLIVPNLLQQRVKSLEQEIYKPHRHSLCTTHHSQRNFTCIRSKCENYCIPICPDCHNQSCNQTLLNINHLVPKLVNWALSEWNQVQKQHRQIESEWKVCLVNINYCMDILREVRKQIEQRSQSVQLTVFPEILTQLQGMLIHDNRNQSVEMLLKNFSKLNEKHQLLTSEERPVNCHHCEQERKHKSIQVQKASNSTKQFSQSALAFSETLAKIIEERVKFEKRVSKLKQLSNNRIFNLKDLLKEQAKPQQVEELMIQVQKGDSNQEKPIQQLIQKCSNLQSLRINNRNGAIEKHRWNKITSGMEYLKQLKQLSLHLKGSDLPILTELFTNRSKAIRQVQRLTLQITDEKELNAGQVAKFINTMQLRSLNLTLSRDNLRKNQVEQLLNKLRLASSMTQLPMTEFNLNLNKNKIDDGKEITFITHLFHNKAGLIKTKSIVI